MFFSSDLFRLDPRQNSERVLAICEEEWKDGLSETVCEGVIDSLTLKIWEWQLSCTQVQLHPHCRWFLKSKQWDVWLQRVCDTKNLIFKSDTPDSTGQAVGSFSLDRLCGDTYHPGRVVFHLNVPCVHPCGKAHRAQHTGTTIKSLQVVGNWLRYLKFFPHTCQIIRYWEVNVGCVRVQNHRTYRERV